MDTQRTPWPLLFAPMTTSVVHEDAAHDLRRDTKEVRAMLPVFIFLPEQAQIHLVDQGCRLQRVPDALLPHIAVRHPVQFGVDQRQQFIERRAVAPAPTLQQITDRL